MRSSTVLHRRSRTIEHCGSCGRVMFVNASQKAYGYGKYCSRLCALVARRGRQSDPIARFMLLLHKASSGCWFWRGYIESNGYGRFWLNKRMERAHRAAHLLLKGPIPDGYEIDHLCRNRDCVNPEHLEAVSKKVNILRGESFVAVQARRMCCPRGHLLSDDNLVGVELRKGKRSCRTCYLKRQRERNRGWRKRRASVLAATEGVQA